MQGNKKEFKRLNGKSLNVFRLSGIVFFIVFLLISIAKVFTANSLEDYFNPERNAGIFFFIIAIVGLITMGMMGFLVAYLLRDKTSAKNVQ